ncbi:serine hydrolase [Acetobacter fabarum]|uniref:serine hydrolase domain-containing protein n=1 Tax=Acetobacter fabarum TaxID=483199 RepID=UPI001404C945|nr:serine hydrolase domain-containing protein [Acetobacter fabarum]NHO42733.1 serine hydrolase [Acetobacter fabarum]GBQ34494.1 beta-lactamase [Acetobacter fabarum DSM 19596]
MPLRTLLTRRKALHAGLVQTTCLAGLCPPAYAQQTQPAPFAPVEEIFRKAIQNGKMPGAVAAIGHEGRMVWRGVFGQRSLLPPAEAMTWDTIFDMASLTKVLITAPSIMQFYERGLIALDTPACHYLPAFAANGKQDITIRQLLTHYSGLAPDLDLNFAWQGKQTGVRMLMNSVPQTPPGEQFVYSDLNFITLGLIVERLSGQPLATYAMEYILKPLGLHNSFFLPASSYQNTIAPTQYDENGHMLRGVVHDPTTRRMGGVAGHAGLFSCAQDTVAYAQALLNKLAGLPSAFPLRAETLYLMSTPQQPAGKTNLRGLGWDIATHYSTARGAYFPSSSFGHTGFTGTSLWLVPNTRSFVMILTNRVHPQGQGNVVALRRDVATAAALALRAFGP